jgi:hypothetical protein
VVTGGAYRGPSREAWSVDGSSLREMAIVLLVNGNVVDSMALLGSLQVTVMKGL